jgi:uncharacterized protein YjbI with pentapeptide repeats
VGDEKSSQPDDSEPTPERQAELRQAYKANTNRRMPGARNPSYSGVKIRTLGELNWIMRERGWSVEQDAGVEKRPDLRLANFESAKLPGVNLRGANLHDAKLDGADFSDANLDEADLGSTSPDVIARRITRGLINFYIALSLYGEAVFVIALIEVPPSDVQSTMINISLLLLLPLSIIGAFYLSSRIERRRSKRRGPDLSRATLQRANLRGTFLGHSSLRGAHVENADLGTAYLVDADLTSGHLEGANLGGADLSKAKLDGVSILREAILDSQTELTDIAWADVKRTRADVGRSRPRGRSRSEHRQDRIIAERDRARVARTVGLALREQGLYAQAAAYRLEELHAERRASRLGYQYGAALFSWLLDVVSGYGEKPGRTFWTYVTVIVTFTSMYSVIANIDIDRRLSQVPWYEWPALSITSFHGRGFFPGTLPPHPWITALALLEAVIGLFIELVFIATFSRRFLGN